MAMSAVVACSFIAIPGLQECSAPKSILYGPGSRVCGADGLHQRCSCCCGRGTKVSVCSEKSATRGNEPGNAVTSTDRCGAGRGYNLRIPSPDCGICHKSFNGRFCWSRTTRSLRSSCLRTWRARDWRSSTKCGRRPQSAGSLQHSRPQSVLDCNLPGKDEFRSLPRT